MIRVNDVNIISIDGANDITVSTIKIFNVPDKLVEPPSKFKLNPVPSVRFGLSEEGVADVAETVLYEEPVIKITKHNTNTIFAIFLIVFVFSRNIKIILLLF